MGVADRVYMRRGGPPPIAPGASWTLRFILILAAAYVLQRGARGWFGVDVVTPLVLSRQALAEGRVWTPLTAAFLHGGTMHLLLNLLGLWYFGKLVEETLGSAKFVAFFLLAAVLSHVPFLLAEPHASTIGASGVVMAALVFAAFRWPGMPFTLIVIPIALWQLAIVYVAIDVIGALDGGSFVDHWTHLGGAAFGFLVHRYGLFPRFKAPVLPHGGRPPRDQGPFVPDDARREIDRILDKINAQGVGSLTEAERTFLKENSGRYR